jgi:hypothetical protein
VVRVWIEPHDDEPRARLVEVGLERDHIARGIDEIERAFDSILRQLFAEN